MGIHVKKLVHEKPAQNQTPPPKILRKSRHPPLQSLRKIRHPPPAIAHPPPRLNYERSLSKHRVARESHLSALAEV